MKRRQVLLITAAVPAGALLAPTRALAGGTPQLTVGIEPLESGEAAFLPLSPSKAGGAAGAKLVLRLAIGNAEATPVTVTGITFSFPNSPVPPTVMQGVDIVIGNAGVINPGATQLWSNGAVTMPNNVVVHNQVYLPAQVPPAVDVAVSCAGFASAYHVTVPLAPYQSPHAFPFRVSDLRPGECLNAVGDHWANGGPGGTQIYAHDVGVKGWDGNAWSALLPGSDGSQNDHYRIWDLPIRAIAGGQVAYAKDGMPDNTPGAFPNPTPNPVTGNAVWIVHNGERVLYPHMRQGTVAVQPGDPVQPGQVIGRVGNSGNTTNPHIHLEIRREIAGDYPLRPWTFSGAWLLDLPSATPWNPDSPLWLAFDDNGIPDTEVLIWPATTRPAWYPPGRPEVTIMDIPIESYQSMFNKVTASGYRPVWFDGYEVGDATYVNVIFRPEDGVPWIAYHGMTGDDYQKQFDIWARRGYRLVNVASFLYRGEVRYAAIWLLTDGPAWLAYHEVGSADHQSQFDQLVSLGYRPIDISIVSPGGKPQYTALYQQVDVGSFTARQLITPADYQTAWDDNEKAGRQLAYLTACQHSGGVRFSAIFQELTPGSGGTFGLHGLDEAAFQATLDAQVKNGALTRVVAGYADGGQATFAGAWRRP
jgi:murein DD-endopeptidase MepM/ murein hydrolase activator NlpD